METEYQRFHWRIPILLSNARSRYIFRTTVGYGIFAAIWILVTDQLLSSFVSVSEIAYLSTIKGLAFVFVTATFLYFALGRVPSDNDQSSLSGFLESSPETVLGISELSIRVPRWLFYVFAVTISIAVLLIRRGIGIEYDQRLMLIIFMFPIILSALLGGMGPGLVATTISAISAMYFFVPPVQSFMMATAYDRFQWGMLVANGIIVSILSEAMRRSVRRSTEISNGLIKEVAERRLAEETLRQSESRYRALEERFRFIFEGALDGMLIADAATKRFVISNPAIVRMTGYSHAELAGLSVKDIHPEKDIPFVLDQFEKQFSGEIRLAQDIPVLRKDGSIFYADIMSSGVTIDGRPCLMGIFRDITERKRLDEEKSKYRQQRELLLETAGEGIFGIDTLGKITFVNKAAAALLGVSRDELIGRSSHEVFHSYRSDGASYPWDECPLCRTLKDGFSRSGEETYFQTEGKGFPIEFTCTAIFEHDVIMGAVMIFHDISARRKMETELRQAQKLEGIGQLAGGIAHDFNNILSAVVGFAGLLQMKMDKADPLVHYADEIMAAGQRGAALTQQILAFSRKQVLDMKPLNLNDVVRGIEKMLQRLVREDIEINYDLSDSRLLVFADLSQLDQILINLITNARDAMPDGGRVNIYTGSFLMDEEFLGIHGYGSPGEYAVLTVADSGTGMDEVTKAHIFEPFFTTKDSGRGTGLGLAVVHGVVKQHNGYISVYSEPGMGSTFRIYLPLTDHPAKDTEMKVVERVRGGHEMILIAEDDASLRRLLVALLNYYGYRVIESVDGEDAVAKFSEHAQDISLVILDGIMPKKNGKEAFDEMRKMDENIRAIFVSGYAEDIFTRDGISEKAGVFIQKPVTPNDLLKKIREVLDSGN